MFVGLILSLCIFFLGLFLCGCGDGIRGRDDKVARG